MMVLTPVGAERERERVPDESAVSQVLKYLLFFLNVLFWLVGLGLMGLGSWAVATKELEKLKVATSAFDYVFDLTVLMMVLGLLVCVVTTLGCVGALRENVCLLRTFAGLLGAALVAFLLAGVGLLVASGPLLRALEASVTEKWLKNYFDDPDLEDLTNWLQEGWACCGVGPDGYEEWGRFNPYFRCGETNRDPRACAVPASCCLPSVRFSSEGLLDPFCGADVLAEPRPASAKRIFVRGCGLALRDSVQRNVYLLGGSALAVAAIPLLQIILALTLVRQVHEQMAKWGRRPAQPYRRPFYARPLGRPAYL